MMALPQDYAERVYAGVLGKIIGVYLGRPFEGWTYERIMRELGEIDYYVHDRLGAPLIVTDDDISGTFTFLRALPDYGFRRDISPAQIGQTWLNYIIERRTILWWGGMGNSTEHTAFLRLKRGVEAPRSGSAALNGQLVSEQIGSQIFIDGWGMVAPGDPEFAADLARRAASVSHDGEAIYGAQVIAAIEAQAFVEPNLDTLLDTALALIPRRSIIARLIGDVREWRAQHADWRDARDLIEQHYGYHIYGGNCHMVPNHALIMLGLLYGGDDMQRALMITNTAGWDTDCNSGNVGCVLGIKNGLQGIDAGPDWRSPIADRLYLPTADGGRAITDAVRETYEVVNIGRALHGLEPLAPKNGARFHWELPGSVQGWLVEEGSAAVENMEGHSEHGTRSLAVGVADDHEVRVATPTFVPPDAIDMPGYTLLASPTLYPGQTVRVRMEADAANPSAVGACLFIAVYSADDQLERRYGEPVSLLPGTSQRWTWRVPPTGGMPIAAIGIELARATTGCVVYLDEVGWDGVPDVRFERPQHGGTMWRRAWVNGADHEGGSGSETYRVIQDEGTGLLMQGTREWRDYTLRALVRPHMARRVGIAVYVQGMRRWYALFLCADNRVRLVRALDGEQVLAEAPFGWTLDQTYALELTVRGTYLLARIDGQDVLDATDIVQPLDGGGIALVVEEGRLDVDDVVVGP